MELSLSRSIGQTSTLHETLPHDAAFANTPNPAAPSPAYRVQGPDRHKYYRPPVAPLTKPLQPKNTPLAPVVQPSGSLPLEPPPQELVRDAATQSLYRESEVQTLPYTPAYTLDPQNPAPEVLTLASLTYADHTLPAGQREVELIEAARARRAFDASLPPLTDEASLEMRRRMSTEQEKRELLAREREMLAQHARDSATFEAVLRDNATALAASWDERVELTRQLKLTEKDKEVSLVQRRRIKALRKLSEARRHAERVKTKRDIVSEYADYGSEVYAPLARNGLSVVRDKLMPTDVRPPQLESLAGLVEIERELRPGDYKVLQTKLERTVGKGQAARKEAKLVSQLDLADAALRKAKQPDHAASALREEMLLSYHSTERVERPATPERGELDADVDELDIAVGMLQRLLRGRAIQNRMYAGKTRRRELIHELRADESGEAEAAPSSSVSTAAGDSIDVAAATDALIAASVSRHLVKASKQLRRFTDETRIARFAAAAEETRRVREAEESGRRQKEAVARAEKAEEFRQILEGHRSCAESLVREAAKELAADAAQQRAEEVRQNAEAAATVALADPGDADAELTAAVGLIGALVVPEVSRRLEVEAAALDDRKFALAASASMAEVVRRVDAALA